MEEKIKDKFPSTAIEYTTTSRVIFIGACFINGVVISGDGANADCQIYDGINDKAPQKLHLEALSGTVANFIATNPVKFNYGIYIVVNAATTKVSICYIPINK